MLTPNDIADRLEELVSQLFPGEPVYRDRVEIGFARPSTLIEYDGGTVDPEAGCSAVEMRDQFTLTTFVEVDEYHNSHLAEMHQRQMKLVGLLVPGYVFVQGRAPKVVHMERGGGYDYNTVQVTLSYHLDRKEFMKLTQLPKMEQLHLNKEE